MAQDKNAAVKAKEKGNALFKEGRLAESAKAYKEAERLDPSNPVYASNLSAALYELGDYVSAMNAVLRSWSSIKSRNDETDAALSLKLSTRLAKCLSQGLQDGTITASLVEQNAESIKDLEGLSSQEKEGSENAHAWNAWKTIRPALSHQQELSHEAKIRLSKMPMYKGMPEPYQTYFVFGTDPIISLVSGWGIDDNAQDPINLRALTKEQISQLSFLIAGVGDGRHGFGTIIGLADAYNKLGAFQKKDLKAHVSLLDINYPIIARNLILYILVDQMIAAEDGDEKTRLEIQATFVYVYMGWIIPSYCHARLMSVCTDIKGRLQSTPPRLPTWLHLDKSSIRPILPILDFWLTNKTLTPARLLKYMSHKSAAESIRSLIDSDYPGVRESMASQRRDAERSLRSISDEKLVLLAQAMRWPGAGQASAKELRKLLNTSKFKSRIVDQLLMAQFDKNIELGLAPEEEWYREVQVFVPPAPLLDRHPGFEAFAKSQDATSDGPSEEAKIKAQYRKLKKVALTEWKANVTLLDGKSDEPLKIGINAFTLVQQIGEFNQKTGIKDKDPRAQVESPAYSYAASFFNAVVDAIKTLGDKLKIELICGEVNHELAKIRLGTDSRPVEFPKKFTRIWLSNIPDYTHGTLSTAMCVLPALQDNMDSSVTSNCLFNSPVWRDDAEFCYNYTLLLPKDLERHLGFRTIRSQAVQTFLTLAPNPLPRPLSALASREQLHSWLGRLLLSLVSPGKSQARPNFVKLPNNLVAFVQLLVELRNIGYPSHWLSDFIHSVLGGTLVVDHLTYKGTIPRPVSELHQKTSPHRPRLDPWYAELETILVSARHGLPFAVQIPAMASSGAKTPEDIGLFKASPEAGILVTNPMFQLPPYDSVVCLVFYKKAIADSERSLNSLISDLPQIVDGREKPARGTFRIFTSVDSIHLKLTDSEVRWRMSKALAQQMKREGWFMAVWRIDMWTSITDPCPAKSWKSVETDA